MKIATWNVNSLRARADRVEAFLERHDIDVLAIQETKCRDENFPWELFERAGYEVVHNGTSQWNGVAIASRVGLSDVQRGFPGQPHFGKGGKDPAEESRAIGATPVLVTPMVRRTFDSSGKLQDILQRYAEAMIAVGAEKRAQVIDLHAASKRLVERLGPAAASELASKSGDVTHFNEKGAQAMAGLVMEVLPTEEPRLKNYLKVP